MKTRLLLSLLPGLLLATPAFAADMQLSPADSSSVYVDATVYHLATPDVVNMSVSCDMQTPKSKADLRQGFSSQLVAIKTLVGSDAKVRRNGTPNMYPSYMDPMMSPSSTQFTGNMVVSVMDIKNGSAQRIADGVEEIGCSVAWDARLIYSAKYAEQMHDELFEQLADKKALYEKLLGVTFSKVSNISVMTSPDYGGSYYGAGSSNSYDPETNTMPAQTTLSITFDLSKPVTK